MGVDHIFMTALFQWNSPHMKLLLRVFEQYILEGKVSVNSQCGDPYDHVYTFGGIAWGRDNIKTFQVNFCNYLSKGTARYVGVWDYDEHFYPLGNYTSMKEVIYDVDTIAPIPYFHPDDIVLEEVLQTWTGGKGLADGDGHPLCYMVLNSAVTLNDEIPTDSPWIGHRYDHGWEPLGHLLGYQKSIRPTAKIFSGGLHLGGACKLPKEWNGGCNLDICASFKPSVQRQSTFSNGTIFNFNLDHRFDEAVFDTDAKLINPLNQALINHIQFHRPEYETSKSVLNSEGLYSAKFFPKVFSELQRRGLDLPISLPETVSIPFPPPDHTWLEFGKFCNGLTPNLSSGNLNSRNANFETDLPSLSQDNTELIIGSIIERVPQSRDL
jgi:hypothetical protein